MAVATFVKYITFIIFMREGEPKLVNRRIIPAEAKLIKFRRRSETRIMIR